MTRPLYEPSPRWGHFSAPINGQLYMWGGHAANFSSNKAEFASTVNIFDPYLETWNKTFPKGSPPPGLYFGACASSGDSLFTYGGSNGVHCGSFHQLNTSTQTWTELESDGPMSKYGSRMIAHGHDLVLFGGYAFPSGSTLQLNSSFVRNYNFSDGRGWTNELHLYSTKEKAWTSPAVSGTRPSPSSYFSITMVDDHRAVMFGGYNAERREKSNDVYKLDLKQMRWTKLNTEGQCPVERSTHAAVCLGYGESKPQLLVTGGRDNANEVLSDAWILDLESGEWKEVEDIQICSRCDHTATVFHLSPGLIEVIIFGGCPEWSKNYERADDILHLASTTILQFELKENPLTAQRDWVLADVCDNSQRGTRQRVKEKMVKMNASSTSVLLDTSRTLGNKLWEMEKRAKNAENMIGVVVIKCEERVKKAESLMEVIENCVCETHGESLEWHEQKIKETESRLDKQTKRLQEVEGELEERVREAERDAERRVQDIKEACDRRIQEAVKKSEERSLNECSRRVTEVENHFTERIRRTSVEYDTKIQEIEQTSEERVRTALRRTSMVEASLQEVIVEREQEIADSQERITQLEQLLEESQERLRLSEQDLSQLMNQWVVNSNEIEVTGPELGRGGWATVNVANFRGTQVAAKSIHERIVSPYNLQRFTREMRMAARLRHPNLVQFIGATRQGQRIILIELMPTSLRKELQKEYMPPSLTKSIGLDVARALNYLHLMQPAPVVHRDISSANVLLEPLQNRGWKAKVADYGSVNLQQNLETICPGNPTYAAPECNDPGLQSPKMDIYSFGVLVVEMLTGQLPSSDERERLLGRIHHQQLLELILRCLRVVREDRPSAADIMSELETQQ